MRHLIVFLELTLHVNRCSLARAKGTSSTYSLVAGSSASCSSSLSQNCSEAAEAPPHRYSWAHIARKQVHSSLARATGPVFFHGSFCLMKVNGRLRGVRGGTIKFLDPFYESQLITALTSRASLPQMSVALRRLSWFHLKLHVTQPPHTPYAP